MASASDTLPLPSPHRGEVLFSWTIFPIALFGSVALSIATFESGGSASLALLLGLGFGYLVVIAGERIHPYVSDWNRSHGDIATDAAWGGTGLATGALFGVVTTAVGAFVGSLLSAWFGSSLWPEAWSLTAQLVIAVVVVEFFKYRIHPFEHEWAWLLRVHATHHTPPRLYWLNALRFHFLDTALLNLGFIAPLVALGAPAPVFTVWIVLSTVHGICQHANMQIRCGPLNWIFSMAELHRWHHSRLVQESNTNYGQNIILWDIVFGTRFLPSDRTPPKDIGIANLPAFPMTWWAQLLSPLRWRQIKEGTPERPDTGLP